MSFLSIVTVSQVIKHRNHHGARSFTTDLRSSFLPKRTLDLFQSLFVGTKLGDTLKKTTLSKSVSKGLKLQECECGSRCNKPLIPYILEKDKLLQAVETGTSMIKLTLPHWVDKSLHMDKQNSELLSSLSCIPSKPSVPLGIRALKRPIKGC